jgi:ABC-type transport system substrate-binding protein
VDLSPTLSSESDEASISSDGRVVITNRGNDDPNSAGSDKLFLQLLDEKGLPKGEPTLLAAFKDIEAVDVTNTLDQGKRFVVYTVDTGTQPDDKLFLQVVSEAGKKIGGKVTINVPPNRDEDAQTVAIDPLGRFVLLTMDGQNYGCSGDDILMYQGLTSNGRKQGAPKPLVGCDFVSNDIKNLDVLVE